MSHLEEKVLLKRQKLEDQCHSHFETTVLRKKTFAVI